MASDKFGNISKQPDGYRVVFERKLKHSAETVWRAITDPAKISAWFMKVDIDFRVGGKITFYFGDPDNTLSYGKITRIEPENFVFEYLWLNDDGPDELAVWQVLPDTKNSCRLLLTYSRLSEKYKAQASAGWHIILDHLEEVLNGRTTPFPYTGGQSDEEKATVTKYEQLLGKLDQSHS